MVQRSINYEENNIGLFYALLVIVLKLTKQKMNWHTAVEGQQLVQSWRLTIYDYPQRSYFALPILDNFVTLMKIETWSWKRPHKKWTYSNKLTYKYSMRGISKYELAMKVK